MSLLLPGARMKDYKAIARELVDDPWGAPVSNDVVALIAAALNGEGK